MILSGEEQQHHIVCPTEETPNRPSIHPRAKSTHYHRIRLLRPQSTSTPSYKPTQHQKHLNDNERFNHRQIQFLASSPTLRPSQSQANSLSPSKNVNSLPSFHPPIYAVECRIPQKTKPLGIQRCDSSQFSPAHSSQHVHGKAKTATPNPSHNQGS
jgi:hypothetical protein